MGPNRIFFPSELLDVWIADERVELAGDELHLREEDRRYRITEAVHILRDAAGGGDAHKLVGKVKTNEQLAALSAEVLESSMILGDDAYDVQPGFVGVPLHAMPKPVPSPATPGVTTEEELLAQFLMKSL